MGEEDPSNPTPLGEPARLDSSIGQGRGDVHKLPEVVHGRMLCVTHGRVCYQRISKVGLGEWICPDERHGKPIKSSCAFAAPSPRDKKSIGGSARNMSTRDECIENEWLSRWKNK